MAAQFAFILRTMYRSSTHYTRGFAGLIHVTDPISSADPGDFGVGMCLDWYESLVQQARDPTAFGHVWSQICDNIR